MAESVLERLQSTNPDAEIWWDSSPLIFDWWVKKNVDAAAAGRKKELEAQLKRLFVWDDMGKSVFRGCTTNPPLSLTAIKTDPAMWEKWVDEAIKANPGIQLKDLWWMTYKEIVKRGAEKLLPLFEASGGRYGWVSGQLDPRLFTEKEVMYGQADELSALSKNVMIKVPASQQGVDVVRYLTSKAISTNTTTCFTLPQIMAVARAAQEGLADAAKNKVNTSGWRAVITHMMGRLTERPIIPEQAAFYGVNWTEADRKWFGIGVFRRAYRMIQGRRLPEQDADVLGAHRPAGERQDALLGRAGDRRRRHRLHTAAQRPRADVRAGRLAGLPRHGHRRGDPRVDAGEDLPDAFHHAGL